MFATPKIQKLDSAATFSLVFAEFPYFYLYLCCPCSTSVVAFISQNHLQHSPWILGKV